MPRALPSVSHDQVALETCALLELLEVLWGRGNEAPDLGPISPSQLRALTVIEKWEGANLRDLGEALGSTPPSVSRLCDRLEAAGLLERSRGTTNRREVELRLSRRGHTVLANMRAWRSREVETVLSKLPAAHLGALAEGLHAFRTAAALHVGLGETGSEDQVPDSA
ncbi:MarR family winged helix-turn-helix transcriptional regulator [Streptomyces sp. NPDC058646]|uniref:MarR family winged helix-turn-helix transcriptional regulator n=1 Tax=Streptomyces sp. NPDC058646 TaxID=3346574 RepID=UPI003657FA5B